MRYYFQLCLLISVTLTAYGKTICYKELGCFSNNYPWFTLLRPLPIPQAPEKINTTFHFSSRTVKKTYVPTWPEIQNHPEFNASKPTFFITHGYFSDSNVEWFHNLTDAILTKIDGNVYAVDWAIGSAVNYFTAAANIRVVAAEILRLINKLKIDNSLSPTSVHLLGHSLGSHIMAYVGKGIRNPSVHRITALDPAKPAFQGKNPLVRIDRADASFIDVIHTDGRSFLPFLGLGMTSGVGDVDLFVNGGSRQPNCILDGQSYPYKSIKDIGNITLSVLYNIVTCSHTRAPRYMAAAVKESCNMWAQRYNSKSSKRNWKKYLTTDKCNHNTCTIMGLETPNYPARGNFAMETSGLYPFCINKTDIDQQMGMTY